METTTVYRGCIGVILGSYQDSGQENGEYYIILGLHRGNIGIMEKWKRL